MGFNTDLFIEQPVDGGLLCSICLAVFDRPTTACTNGHFFCAECLNQTTTSQYAVRNQTDKNCPECRLPMLAQKILNRPLNSILLAMKVRCRNESSASSRRKISEAGVDGAALSSTDGAALPSAAAAAAAAAAPASAKSAITAPANPYAATSSRSRGKSLSSLRRFVTDPNHCCAFQGTLAEYVETKHADSCPLRLIKCTVGCEERVIFSEMDAHKVTCTHREVSCPSCSKKIQFHQIQFHQENSCPEKLVPCGFCNVSLKRKNLGSIRGFPNNGIASGGARLTAASLTIGAGSRIAVREEDLSGHYRVCPKIPISCEFHPFGCTTKIPRQRMAAHHADKAQHHASLVSKETKKIQTSMTSMETRMRAEQRLLRDEMQLLKRRVKKTFLWKIERDALSGEGNKTVDSKCFTANGHELFFRLFANGSTRRIRVALHSKPSQRERITVQNVRFETTAFIEEEDECFSSSYEADSMSTVRLLTLVEKTIVSGELEWYDDDGESSFVTKEQFLGCSCAGDSHVHIDVAFEISIDTRETV